MTPFNIRSTSLALIAGISWTMLACSINSGQEGLTDDRMSANEPQEIVPQLKTEAAMDLDQQIAFSVQDLAKRLDIEAQSISIVAARQVHWPSAALGCPESGMAYTQVMVPGVVLILNAGDENYGYHAKLGGQPFYCPRDRAQNPALMQPDDFA